MGFPSWDRAPSPPPLSLFSFLYFFLPVFEDNDLLFWVPDVLCQHSEVVLWNLLRVQMFFWSICGGESGLHILFLRHLLNSTHSIVFLYFFALVTEEGILILLAILWNFAFKWVYLCFSPLLFASLFSQLSVRPPQTASLLFCISFSWEWSWFLSPVQCHESVSIVHQALCLFISHFHCIVIRDLI